MKANPNLPRAPERLDVAKSASVSLNDRTADLAEIRGTDSLSFSFEFVNGQPVISQIEARRKPGSTPQ